jgi:arylsulfatase
MPRSSTSAAALVVAATAAAASSGMAAAAAARQQTQPHLVFMMADQLRWNTNGYRGGERNLTVNLDRIAAEGLEMKYSFASTPTCTPARASLLTGQSPWNHGMLGCA